MGFDEEKSKFVHTWVRKGKKKSKHDRKAKSLAKRNTWLEDEEDEIAPDAIPEEDVFETKETLAPDEFGYDIDEFEDFISLDAEQIRTIADAYDRLDAIEEVIRYLPSIRDYFDEDFYETLNDSIGYAEELLDLEKIENTAFIDGLMSQVTYLESEMLRGKNAWAKKIEEEKAASRKSATETTTTIEKKPPESSRGTTDSSDDEDDEKGGPSSVPKPVKESKAERKVSRRKQSKSRRKKGVDITAQLFADMPKFPADFRASDYSGVTGARYEVLDVDRYWMKQDSAIGYKTGFFKLVPKSGAPLAGMTLMVHVHFYSGGGFRSDVKVIPEGYEGATNGTTIGSSNCVRLSNGQAIGLGVSI